MSVLQIRSCVLNKCDGGGALHYNRYTGKQLKTWQDRVKDGRNGVARICDCVEINKSISSFKWSVVDGLELHNFENFEKSRQPDAYAAANEFSKSENSWLFMSGANGTGKSHLAAASIATLKSSGRAAILLSVPSMLDRLRPKYDDSAQILGNVCNIDVLGLDDLGTESPSAWVCETIFRIIDYRSGCKKKTLITSNLSLNALSKRGGDWRRIADRIMEHSFIPEIRPGSYRLILAKNRHKKG